MRITPTSTPATTPTMAPVDRPSSDSVAPPVELTDGVTAEVVGKTVEDGVMITLDTTMTSTEGKITQCVIANYKTKLTTVCIWSAIHDINEIYHMITIYNAQLKSDKLSGNVTTT